VPDGELMGKIGEEEEAKQRELLKQMKPLRDAGIRMSDAANELAVQGATELVMTGTVARCDTVDDALKSALGDVISVRNAYDRIVREYRLNQLDPHLTKKVYEDVAKPLGEVVDKQFDVTIASVRSLRRTVDDKSQTVAERSKEAGPKAREAQKQIGELLRQLNDIIDKMKSITEITELIKLLQEIEDEEWKLEKRIQQVRAELIKRLLEGATKP
jgi:methyl-accepting chemotaxis protein